MRSHFLYSLIGVLLAAESLLAVPTPPKRQVRFFDEQDPASASYAQGGQSSQPQYPVAPQGGQSSLNPQIPDSGPSSQAGLGGQQHRPLSPFPEFADLFRQNPPPAGQPAPAVPERRLGSPIQFSSNPQGQSAVRSAYPVPGTSSHRPLSPVRPSFSPHIQDPGPSNQAASGTHGRRPLSPTLPTSESPGRNTATPGRTTSGSQRQASTSSDSSSFSFQAPQDGPWPELTNIEERYELSPVHGARKLARHHLRILISFHKDGHPGSRRWRLVPIHLVSRSSLHTHTFTVCRRTTRSAGGRMPYIQPRRRY